MALERAAWLEREFGARVDWLPFDLHPEYPPEGIPRDELRRRYPEDVNERTRQMVEGSGMPYNPPPEVVPRSRKALEVTELARELGLHEQVHARLMRAYWAEGQNIGDEEVLLGLVAEAGVDRDEAAAALADGSYAARVDASTAEAQRNGINAIPAFVLGKRLLLLGAQPHEVFERALEQLAETNGD
ncbi:MAG TPA: DsbA family protein [Gaiellaceae bacterium]|nr:DsbA family protein [Gaiellaceae bacterium]